MDELTYRHQRFPFIGKVYWKRFHDPWQLFVVVKSVNISLSGILTQKPLSYDIAQTTNNILQINDDNHTVILPALVVRHNESQLAFSFKQTTIDLEQLIAHLSQQQP